MLPVLRLRADRHGTLLSAADFRVKSCNAKAQIATHFVLYGSNCNCSSRIIRTGRAIPGCQCSDRLPAWRLGADCRNCLHRCRDCWLDCAHHSPRSISPMVSHARASGHLLLDNISSAFTLGNGIQLERTLPVRAAFSTGGNLCCDGSVVAGGALAHYHKLDHIHCKYHFYPRTASHIFNRSKYYASASIADLQLRQFRDYWLLYRIEPAGMVGGIF